MSGSGPAARTGSAACQGAEPQASAPASATATRRVALVGRPNAGKTSLLMHLSGTLQRPVNFAGTSVERTESETNIGERRVLLVDLPGMATLQPLSRDEQVALDYLRGVGGPPPDLLVAVLDASRLLVELRFLQELRALGLPVVVAMTKLDVAAAEGNPVDLLRLQQALGVPLVACDGRSARGSVALRELLAGPWPSAPQPAAGREQGTLPVSAQAPGVPSNAGRSARRSRTDRIDAVLLHPWLGPVLLAAGAALLFQAVFRIAEPFMAVIEQGQGLLAAGLTALLPAGALRSCLVDGVVQGLGTTFMFVPQIALLIAGVAVLEASGYMARAVFLLDRLLRAVGLTGKSFVPLMSSFGCAIPGILASRILTDERDRLATIAVAPLMSCSARLPVYVVLLAAFFSPEQAGLLLLLLYLLGALAAAAVATVLRRTMLRGGTSLLLMELPVYQRPSLRLVWRQTWVAVGSFVRTAGTVILAATVLVWALAYYPRPVAIHEQFAAQVAAAPAGPDGDAERERLAAEEARAYLEQSWLADLGRTVQPLFAPAGFDWRLTVSVLAAFPARELVVPTLGTLHSLGTVEADADPESNSVHRLRDALRTARGPDGKPLLDGLTALAAMAFFALCSQCASTLAAIRRETHSWFWPAFTFTYMTALAWLAAVGIQQVGRWLGFGG